MARSIRPLPPYCHGSALTCRPDLPSSAATSSRGCGTDCRQNSRRYGLGWRKRPPP
nr:MAG TPA: hypothetical protein [Caudoviricetes sp.]DAO77186.1 MAG TPA: hypothetical protein [Caudoviricetes sp.]